MKIINFIKNNKIKMTWWKWNLEKTGKLISVETVKKNISKIKIKKEFVSFFEFKNSHNLKLIFLMQTLLIK